MRFSIIENPSRVALDFFNEDTDTFFTVVDVRKLSLGTIALKLDREVHLASAHPRASGTRLNQLPSEFAFEVCVRIWVVKVRKTQSA